MKIATWNVNSLKVRLPQVLTWVYHERPDIVCLQETKTEDMNFPAQGLREAGYYSAFAGQRAYNGVTILTRIPASDVVYGIPGFADEQKRLLAVTAEGTRVVCAYVPNGESVESEKYRYKLSWLAALNAWLRQEVQAYPRLALLGDFNIAPQERDVHDPKLWEGKVLFSEPERTAFQGLLALGLKDSFRLFEQPERLFSWWDYRMNAFKRNLGLRIDHILLSQELADRARSSRIEKSLRGLERPSDHAPVVTELE
jgi:exodeoxyribonuclease-3